MIDTVERMRRVIILLYSLMKNNSNNNPKEGDFTFIKNESYIKYIQMEFNTPLIGSRETNYKIFYCTSLSVIISLHIYYLNDFR